MKKIIPLLAATMFLAGCGNNNAGYQSTNAPAEQQMPAAGTNSTGMDTNTPAMTNNANMTTNMTPQ